MTLATARPKCDLSAFIKEVLEVRSGRITLGDAMIQVNHEIDLTQRSFSRDPRERFEQIRYVNSLSRLAQFLNFHALPSDLTPRERLAFKKLGECLHGRIPESLSDAFSHVTLPQGVFGHNFELNHRMA